MSLYAAALAIIAEHAPGATRATARQSPETKAKHEGNAATGGAKRCDSRPLPADLSHTVARGVAACDAENALRGNVCRTVAPVARPDALAHDTPHAPPGAPADAWTMQWQTALRILELHREALEAAGWSRAELLACGVSWWRFDQRGPLMLMQPDHLLVEISPDRLCGR